MDRFTRADFNALLEPRDAPCVSLYRGTRRGGGEADLVRWKDALNEAEQRLTERGVRSPDARALLADARALPTNKQFWNGCSDGLAAFIAGGFMRQYRLPLAVPNRVVVGPRFHVTPLLRWVDGDGRFHVLALSQNAVRVFDGTAHSVQPVAVPNLPANL